MLGVRVVRGGTNPGLGQREADLATLDVKKDD